MQQRITRNMTIWYRHMAQAVAESAGAELIPCADFDASKLDDFDAVAFRCPSMGAEQLEEDEFEPMFTACSPKLSGKKIALFGSYGWGDGEWMRTWQEQCESLGAVLVAEPVICNETPDDEALEACKTLGQKLAQA